MPCMDGIVSKVFIDNNNLANLRTFIDQIRSKHSLTAISWSTLPADGVTDQAIHLNEVENNIRRFNESEFIGTITGLPTITVGNLITLNDLTVTDAKLYDINQICVDRTSDYTAYKSTDYTTNKISDYTTERNDWGSEGGHDSDYNSCDEDFGATQSVCNDDDGYCNFFDNVGEGAQGGDCSEYYNGG